MTLPLLVAGAFDETRTHVIALNVVGIAWSQQARGCVRGESKSKEPRATAALYAPAKSRVP